MEWRWFILAKKLAHVMLEKFLCNASVEGLRKRRGQGGWCTWDHRHRLVGIGICDDELAADAEVVVDEGNWEPETGTHS